jgi:hypothetical protein
VPDPEEFVENCSSNAEVQEALQASIASYLNNTVAPDDIKVNCSIDSGGPGNVAVEYQIGRRRLAGNVTIDYEISVPEEEAQAIQDNATELLSSQASGEDLSRLATIIGDELSASAPSVSGNAPLEVIGGPPAISVISTHHPTPSPTPSPTLYPTPSPTPGPTPIATPTPTPSPTPSLPMAVPAVGAIAATGDPHLQNVYGERFDLMRPGKHVLVNIPRGEPVENALLRVEADAVQLGVQCADMYFQELNMTGAWAESKWAGGLHVHAQDVKHGQPKWIHVGKVDVKVVHGHTQEGSRYLNFYVKHLGRAGFAVGGLLGEDDHTEAAMPSRVCIRRRTLSLLELSR